jgi:hypothetical protein
MDIKGPNHGRSLHQVLYDFLHRVELFAFVGLGVLAAGRTGALPSADLAFNSLHAARIPNGPQGAMIP